MENYIENNGIKIWTDIRGTNKNGYLILCNGGPGSCDYLKPVSKMIEDSYCVIRFEQRGCGRSDADGKYDMFTAIEDLEAIREHYGIKNWIVGGHSWGANLSLCYAIKHIKNTNAILYIAGNGVQHNREWSAEYHANLKKNGEQIPQLLYEGNTEVNKICNLSFHEYIQCPSLYKDISLLRMRALFVCAANDIRPNWPSEQIFNLMQNAEIVFIENAAHYIWLSQYDKMKYELRTFLDLSVP